MGACSLASVRDHHKSELSTLRILRLLLEGKQALLFFASCHLSVILELPPARRDSRPDHYTPASLLSSCFGIPSIQIFEVDGERYANKAGRRDGVNS